MHPPLQAWIQIQHPHRLPASADRWEGLPWSKLPRARGEEQGAGPSVHARVMGEGPSEGRREVALFSAQRTITMPFLAAAVSSQPQYLGPRHQQAGCSRAVRTTGWIGDGDGVS